MMIYVCVFDVLEISPTVLFQILLQRLKQSITAAKDHYSILTFRGTFKQLCLDMPF